MIKNIYSKNDIFLVTGATSGIGKAVSLSLLEKGAKVIAFGRNDDKLNILLEESKYHEDLIIINKDLSSDFDSLPKFILELSREYGKFRGCILSAGVLDITPLKVLKEENAKALFNVNYFSSLYMAKAFCDKRVNIGEGSSLVFLSSIASIEGNPGIINYAASKGAINSLVKSLAKEVSLQKIRVNSILPGTTKTEMLDNCSIYTNEYLQELEKKYPLGLGKVEDIVEPILFLLSDKSKWITGTNIIVDGGATL